MTCPAAPGDDRCTDQTACPLCPHDQPLPWGWVLRAALVAAAVGCLAAAALVTLGLVALAVLGLVAR